MISRLLNGLLSLYELLIFVYVILSWIRPAANKWTTAIGRLVEPVLEPIRRFLREHIPQNFQILDFSPWVCILLIRVLKGIISSLFWFI